jgi:hypothetical protein
MTNNDQVVLAEHLSQRRQDEAPETTESEFFELFASSEILKDHELSWDEIEQGSVGGGGDGGIDAVYVFVNGTLICEDTDLGAFKKDPVIDLFVVQAKRARGFSEDALTRFRSASEDLLDLTKDMNALRPVYNDRLLERFTVFRDVYKTLASRLPGLRIHIHYATMGAEVHDNVRRQGERLKRVVEKLYSNADCSVTYSGASELLSMARKRPRTTFELTIKEGPIAGDKAYVGLVTLAEYARFISDDSGGIRRSLFEANVSTVHRCGVRT